MAVACPPVEWPKLLEEQGPAEDPGIVLKGTARIGGAPVEIVAIRVDLERRRMPDYRSDVPRAAYETAALETTLEELECVTQELSALTGVAERSIVRFATGSYVLFVLPAR
jgi:hypothetical protein